VRWLVPLLMAALPLQWISLGNTPVGPGRLHVLVLFAVTAVAALRLRPRSHLPVLRVGLPFLGALCLLLALWLVAARYHGSLPVEIVQQAMYVAATVVIGTLVYRAAVSDDRRAVRLLRWSASLAVGSLLLALSYSMLHNGVSPMGAFGRAVASADPSVIEREVFRSSFSGFGYDPESARSQFRHEIFAAVLVAMLVSAWASRLEPFTRRWASIVYRVAMVLCVALLLVSLSRAVLIAALAWPLVSLLRTVRLFALSSRQIAAAYASVAAVGVVVVSGIGTVLWARFTQDTTSYHGRTALYASALSRIGEHPFLGGADVSGTSSHNFVLDAWLRGGVLMAAAAGVAMVVLAMMWLGWLARVHRDPAWMVPAVAAFALPLDRMLTAGGGLIPPPEWVTIAFILGALAYRRHLHASRRTDRAGLANSPVPA
jgi:hypothetical protein